MDPFRVLSVWYGVVALALLRRGYAVLVYGTGPVLLVMLGLGEGLKTPLFYYAAVTISVAIVA